MRYAVISDIHSNYKLFSRVLEEIKNKNIDAYIFLGDYVTDGFEGEKVVQTVSTLHGYTIAGNRERYVIEYEKSAEKEAYETYTHMRNIKFSYESLSPDSRAYIKQLKDFQIITLGNKKICMAHSTPYSDSDNIYINGSVDSHEMFDKMIKDFDCDIYLLGHEHISYHTIYQNRHFINPGSVGIPCYEYPLSYGILEIQEDKMHYENIKIDYDYAQMEDYYKKSPLYKEAKHWCDLLLENFRDGKNHIDDVLQLSREKMKQRNMTQKYIPNDIYEETVETFISKLKKERRTKSNETSSNI